MAQSKFNFWPPIIGFIAIVALVIALPNSWKPWAPDFLKPELHLGLDLAGGTQLDFRISEEELRQRKVNLEKEIEEMKGLGSNEEILRKQNELLSLEEQERNLVEAIRTVLERRINSLGVSEATITPSYFGEEKHLLVECPGVVDKEKCLATVGKTIQLEFKEQFTGEEEGYADEMRARADQAFAEATGEEGSLKKVGEDLSDQLGITYFDTRSLFVSSLPSGLTHLVSQRPEDGVRKTTGTIQSIQQTDSGPQITQVEGVYLTEVLQPTSPTERVITDVQEALEILATQIPGASVTSENTVELSTLPQNLQTTAQTMTIGTVSSIQNPNGTQSLFYLSGRTEGGEEVGVSHILVQYQNGLRADPSVTRSREEAQARANELKDRLDAGENFVTLASAESDGESAARAGSLGTLKRGVMGDAFDSVAFSQPTGSITDVVETPFGFHIIRVDEEAKIASGTVSYTALNVPTGIDPQSIIAQIQNQEVVKEDEAVVVRSIFFSLEPTGWKDTALNGERFRAASVTVDPTTNVPVVQIQFDEEGGKLFQELTKRNINKPIAIFVGGELVSAPVVQTEIVGGTAIITGSESHEEARLLAQDLNTGAIPAPIFLAGQTTVEATLGADALRTSVQAAGLGLLLLCLFMLLIYRTFGFIAISGLAFYIVLMVAAMKLPLFLISNQYIVLSLAGMAGLILSIGMAVDANVLIFERIKEELRKGKLMKTSVETGFKRAWPSIRDGNVSTLITCSILFTIGTSIIKGFSITLSIGILISVFTAVVVARWMCRKLAASPLGEKIANQHQ